MSDFNGYRWETATVSYYVYMDDYFSGLVDDAVQEWEQYAALDFVPTDDPWSADLTIGWEPQSSVLVARTIPQSDGMSIMISSTEDWWSGDFDFSTVIVHEVGHASGLAHTDNTDSIMFENYYRASHEITEYDIANIQALYGQPVYSSFSPTGWFYGDAIDRGGWEYGWHHDAWAWGWHWENGWDYGWYQNAAGWGWGWFIHQGWEWGWYTTGSWDYGWWYDYGGQSYGWGWNLGW